MGTTCLLILSLPFPVSAPFLWMLTDSDFFTSLHLLGPPIPPISVSLGISHRSIPLSA